MSFVKSFYLLLKMMEPDNGALTLGQRFKMLQELDGDANFMKMSKMIRASWQHQWQPSQCGGRWHH